MQEPIATALATLCLPVRSQLLRLAEKASAPAMLRSLALVVSHVGQIKSHRRLCPNRGSRRVGVLAGRYHRGMAHVTKLSKSEVERRRAAAERMRGLFADVAPDRSLVDELIADRRAEAAAESGESAVRQRRGG